MIDCHLHIWAADNSSPEKRAERAEQLITEMDALGIDRIALMPDMGETVEECREENRVAAKYVEEYPDRFYGWAVVDPRLGEAGVAEFRRAVEEDGLIGLKHHSNWSEQPISAPELDPYLEAAIDMDVPVIAHVTQRTREHKEEFPYESQTEHVREVAERYPDLDLITAHIAAGGDWERRIKNLADLDSVYLDISGTNCEVGMVEMAVDYLGTDRLVFGTDTWLVPGAGKLVGCDLTPEEKAEIAYNFESLVPDSTPNKLGDVSALKADAAERFRAADEPREETIVDANAFIGDWPFHPVEGEPEELLARMDRKGVDKALVSSIRSVFSRNVMHGNDELFDAVAGHEDRLIPVATIDPSYTKWREDMETCLDRGAKAVKLLPTYHGYDLDEDPVFDLLDLAADRGVPVIFAAALEDLRKAHPSQKLHRSDEMFRDSWCDAHVEQLVDLLTACSETDVIVADCWDKAAQIKEDVVDVHPSGVRLDNDVREGKTYFVLDDLFMFFSKHQGEHIAMDVGVDHLVCGAQLPFKIFDATYNYCEHLPVDEEARDRIRAGNVLDLLA